MPEPTASEADEKSSALDDLALVKRIRADLKLDKSAREAWRKEAETCYRFVAGEQWDEGEEQDFIALKRAPVKFNRIEPIVNVVCGMEVGSRKEVRYLAREPGDSGAVEVWNAAGDWARDGCAAEDEESEQFSDAVISGEGWADYRLDYDEDPDGKIVIERVDGFEVFPDRTSKKRNYEDMRRVSRVQKRPLDWVAQTWPKKKEEIEGHDFLSRSDDEILSDTGANKRGQNRYDGEGSAASGNRNREVEVIEHQYLESETYYRVQDPTTKAFTEMSAGDAAKLKARMAEFGMPLEAVKMRRDVAYRCFIAGELLLEKSKCPDPTKFSLFAITGKRDRRKKMWYGLVRPLMDPQRLQNKTLILMMDILANNAKGGVFVEKSAIEPGKTAEFERTYADYRAVTWVADGSISMNRILPKASAPLPPALGQLLEVASNSFSLVSGVSPELMGMTQIDQPAALEVTRKQSGFTMLATLFDAQRRYRKHSGSSLLFLINEYIADGRLVRIVGKQGEQFIPLIKQPGALRYDVVVDDAPTSPNEKERVWALLQTLIPMLKGMGVPIPPELIEYLPLPESVIEIWKKQLQPKPEQQQEAQIRKQIELQTAQAEIKKTEAEAAAKIADAEKTKAEAALLPTQVQAQQLDVANKASELEDRKQERTHREREMFMTAQMHGEKLQDAKANRDEQRQGREYAQETERMKGSPQITFDERAAGQIAQAIASIAPSMTSGIVPAIEGVGQRLEQAFRAPRKAVRDPNTNKIIGSETS